MDEQLVTIGGELKALGDGKVGGYLVRFGDAETPDATGDYFTADTDFGIVDRAIGWVHHRQPMESPKTGQKARYTQRLRNPVKLVKDDIGILAEVMLDLRDTYENMFYKAADAGKLGWSSGTAPHLVEREYQDNGTAWITAWPLGLDASITPIPAEPRTSVVPLKSYMELSEPYVKALLPQVDAGSDTADATEATTEPPTTNTKGAQTPTGDDEMTPEEIQAMIAQASETAAAAAVKAYEEKLAAEPPTNPMEYDTGNGATKSATKSATKPAEVKAKPEAFKSLGEQLDAIRRSSTPGYSVDRRLTEMKAISGMSETVPEDGGYLVQTDFASELLRLTHETGLLTGRVRRIPVGANSNGLKMNAVAETSRATGSRWGGVRAYWREEAGTVTAAAPAFRTMKLELNDLMGLCYATDQLLADSVALGAVIQQAFSEEFGFLLDDAIIRGSGNGQPLGIMNSNAYVSVAKESGQAADTVMWENINNMWARLWSKSRMNSAWFIHQDVLPQLNAMNMPIGTGGVPVYLPATGIAGSPYSTLFGRPVIEIEQADTVGDQGDIMLLDLSQYLMIDKGGLEAAQSIHVRFIYGENTFRFTLRTDGQPIWNSPLTLYNSSTTVAPFVLLDARA